MGHILTLHASCWPQLRALASWHPETADPPLAVQTCWRFRSSCSLEFHPPEGMKLEHLYCSSWSRVCATSPDWKARWRCRRRARRSWRAWSRMRVSTWLHCDVSAKLLLLWLVSKWYSRLLDWLHWWSSLPVSFSWWVKVSCSWAQMWASQLWLWVVLVMDLPLRLDFEAPTVVSQWSVYFHQLRTKVWQWTWLKERKGTPLRRRCSILDWAGSPQCLFPIRVFRVKVAQFL